MRLCAFLQDCANSTCKYHCRQAIWKLLCQPSAWRSRAAPPYLHTNACIPIPAHPYLPSALLYKAYSGLLSAFFFRDVVLQTQTVLQGGHAALSVEASSRMSCEWTHPAKLACTAGRNLVQCQLAGLGQQARAMLLHSRPEEDDFLALARPSQVIALASHCIHDEGVLCRCFGGRSLHSS